MLVKDIWDDLEELTGTCDTKTNYRALSLGLEWLANKQLFDPFIGYIEFRVDGGHTIALPREVKTPIKLNISNNPSFHRSRFYEFHANMDGSVDGPSVGYTWDNRGYSCVHDERYFPAKLLYFCENDEDEGKTLKIVYNDALSGRKRKETLLAHPTAPIGTEFSIGSIDSIVRQETVGECLLVTPEEIAVARYYSDELRPEYRVIKLSQTGVAIRMMFRRHAPPIFSSQEDVIPFHSRLAIIHAARAVRYFQKELYDEAKKAMEAAEGFAKDEQNTRDEDKGFEDTPEVVTARNQNIDTLDSLIVADVYDEASMIFGPIGREKLFDKISLAREVLAKKAHWDAATGIVDIWRSNTANVETVLGRGHAEFTLPRYVGAVLRVNVDRCKTMPRNRWFEFHLNGGFERSSSSSGTWDDMTPSPIINGFPVNATTRRIIPVRVIAVPDLEADEGARVMVYGRERLANGREVEVYRNGKPGYLCPCRYGNQLPDSDSPAFVHIDRIDRDKTQGFVNFYGYKVEDTVSFAFVADCGDASAESTSVSDLVKAFKPLQVILAGDVDYRDRQDFEVLIGSILEIDATITIPHRRGVRNINTGDTVYIRDVARTVATITRDPYTFPGDPDFDEFTRITVVESIADLEGDEEVIFKYDRERLPEDTIDINVGRNWRKFMKPYLGDQPLLEGETASPENYLWAAPGNHDYTQTVDDSTWWQNDGFDAGPAVPDHPLDTPSLEAVSWSVDVAVEVILHFNPVGNDWEITVYNADGGGIVGNGLVTAAGGQIDTGFAEFNFGPINNAVGEVMQITVKREFSETNLTEFLEYFSLPKAYHKKRFGEVDVFFLNSEPQEPDGRTVGSTQYNWLVAQIAASTATWKIVVLHRSPYTSGEVNGPSETMRAWDFSALGIDAVISGHEHNYERLLVDGVSYFVVGTGGRSSNLYELGDPIEGSKFQEDESNGALFLTASKNTLAFQFRNTANEVLDSYAINKGEIPFDTHFGYWYPDETRPHYRRIKIARYNEVRVRLMYRLRTLRISSLYDPLHLRSAMALIEMLHSLKARGKDDDKTADTKETNAIRFLGEQEFADNPTDAVRLQFAPGTTPGGFGNIS